MQQTPMWTRSETVAAWAVAQRSADMVWKVAVYMVAVSVGLCGVSDAVAALGPLAIKLAQAATARPDLFLAAFIEALRPLQDRVPAEPVDDLPDGAILLASGSVAQVYACETANETRGGHAGDAGSAHDSDDDDDGAGVFARHRSAGLGRPSLVVKVRRPTVLRRAAVDRVILVWFMRTWLGRALVARACRRTLAADAIDHLVAIADDGLSRHVDLAAEASNAERMRALFADDPSGTVFVPRTVAALSTSERLFMERVDGVPIACLPTAAARSSAARLLVEATCRMVFKHGLLHGDIHEGNVLCVRNSDPAASDVRVRIALLDMGVVHDVDAVQRRLIVLLLRTAIGAEAPDLLAACIYSTKAALTKTMTETALTPARCALPRRSYARFVEDVTAAVAAGRHGSDLGAFVDGLARACADSGVAMDRDMIARVAPLVAADAIARTYMAPSLTVTACSLYGGLFS